MSTRTAYTGALVIFMVALAVFLLTGHYWLLVVAILDFLAAQVLEIRYRTSQRDGTDYWAPWGRL